MASTCPHGVFPRNDGDRREERRKQKTARKKKFKIEIGRRHVHYIYIHTLYSLVLEGRNRISRMEIGDFMTDLLGFYEPDLDGVFFVFCFATSPWSSF